MSIGLCTVRSGQRLAIILAAGACSLPLRAQAPADTTPAVSVRPDSVSIGYGQRRAADVTGAVTRLEAPSSGRGSVVSPEQLLRGVAGVQVVDNGEPGGSLAVRIRGGTSIYAAGDPLYVVDGMPVSVAAGAELGAGRDPLNVLNPADIESITVLRDAAAGAIYGVDATNGVVLITTRSGRGEPRIEYDASMSSSDAARFSPVLNATEFRVAVQQYAPQSLAQLGSATTDWFDQVSHSAFGQAHDLAVSNAWQGGAYRLSIGYLDQGGVLQASAVQRLTLGIGFDQRLFADHLDVRANVRGARLYDRFTPDGVLSNAAAMAPTQPVLDPTAATGYWNWPVTGPSTSNPVEIQRLAEADATTWRALGNIQADYRLPFLDALSAHVNLGHDITRDSQTSFYPSTLHSQVQGAQGTEYLATPRQSSSVLEAWLDYAAALGFGPGSVDLTAGYSNWELNTRYPAVSLSGLSTNLLGTNGLPPATTVLNVLGLQSSHLVSWFGRVQYDLADRYGATLSLRRDHSSIFAPGRGSGTFPAVGLAWRISREPFLAFVTPLADLALRASWGRTGNQSLGALPGSPLQAPAVDPNLRWESTTSWGAGIDFGLFRQTIRGTVDWYTRRTDDLIAVVPVAAGVNFANYIATNVGSVRNRGLELSLTAEVLHGASRNLHWTAEFTAAHNANELLDLAPGQQAVPTGAIAGGIGTTIQVLQPGQPVNAFFVCQQAYQGGKPVENGYVAVAGGGVVQGCTAANLRAYHDPAPRWILGHTSTVTWAGLDLAVTLRAWTGNYVYDNVASSMGNYSALGTGAPFNLSADVLRSGFVTAQLLSDYYVRDASFLRVDDITLGYSFTVAGQRWRVFATVQNAVTFTGYRGGDPAAAGLTGIDGGGYPTSRSVTGGVSVRL